MPTITINGRKKKVDEGLTILDAARDMDIRIPTLCYHEALTATGACRICVVEIKSGKTWRVMASCVTKVEDGMSVRTDTDKIRNIRRTLLELLLARCPDLPALQRLASEYGVKGIPYRKDNEDCFLCGLCVRACEEIVGASAIGFAYRGIEEKIAAPFSEVASACISCGTCTTVCPVQTFDVKNVDRGVSLHTFAQKLMARNCEVCEEHYFTRE